MKLFGYWDNLRVCFYYADQVPKYVKKSDLTELFA